MRTLGVRALLFLLLDVCLVASSFLQVPYLLDRPRVPFVLSPEGEAFVVTRVLDAVATGSVSAGDTVTALCGFMVHSPYDTEFFADARAVGDSVPVVRLSAGTQVPAQVTLIPYFSYLYVVIVLLVGLVTCGVGIFVLAVKPREPTAVTLHWALMSLGLAVMFMWGRIPPGETWPHLSRALYFLSYMGTAVLFCFFTTIFPRRWPGSGRVRVAAMFLPALLIVGLTTSAHFRALSTADLDAYDTFRSLFHIFRFSVVAYVAIGLVNFIRAYRKTDSTAEKRKLQWILWALTVGPAPFLLLEVIPEFFVPVSPVPEEYTLIFLIIIPVAFAISCVKYHILDVQVVINRTSVYTIVMASMFLLYLSCVGGVTYLVGRYTLESAALAAMIVAVAFEPVRKRVQKFVDLRFFRVQYDFRLSERRLVESLRRSATIGQLAESLVGNIDDLIPVERVGFFLMRPEGMRLQVIAHRNFGVMEGRGVRFDMEHLQARMDIPVALGTRLEPGIEYQPADEHVFSRWRISVLIAMLAQDRSLLGFLALGDKRSGHRFSSEDVDLLMNLTTQAGLDVERILLQERVTLEQAEAQRQRELNEMKTVLVRTASHELRDPLTPIRLAAEIIRKSVPRSKRNAREWLDTIEGEVDRLDRLVTTILASARVDQDVMVYHFHEADLGEVVEEALKLLGYLFAKEAVKVSTSGLGARRRFPVRIDQDAVKQAFMNVVTNAVKYSHPPKSVHVRLSRRKGTVRLAIQDRGFGMPPDVVPKIFDRYFRDPAQQERAPGLGLGLPLVKHIMDAHGGSIDVVSTVGVGSTFTLIFPLRTGGETEA